MKRRKMKIMVMLFAILALSSIGFASWIIQNPNIEGEKEGSFLVYDVVEKNMEATTTFEGENSTFIFGKPADYEEQSTDWFKASSDVEVQNLSVTINVKITNADQLPMVGSDENIRKVKMNFQVSENFKNLNDAITKNLIQLDGYNIDQSGKFSCDVNLTLSDESSNGKTYKVGNGTVTLTFKWGTEFGEKNPYEYYNNLSFVDNKAKAETNLKALYNLNGLKFTIKYEKPSN